jgi:hypothetical protein
MENIIEEEFEDDVIELNPSEEPFGSQSKRKKKVSKSVGGPQ